LTKSRTIIAGSPDNIAL